MSGANDFPIKITISDIVTITNRAADTRVVAVEEAVRSGATVDDLRTIEVLIAFQGFMKDHHCDPGFELEFA
jgi:hypothetical protein